LKGRWEDYRPLLFTGENIMNTYWVCFEFFAPNTYEEFFGEYKANSEEEAIAIAKTANEMVAFWVEEEDFEGKMRFWEVADDCEVSVELID